MPASENIPQAESPMEPTGLRFVTLLLTKKILLGCVEQSRNTVIGTEQEHEHQNEF